MITQPKDIWRGNNNAPLLLQTLPPSFGNVFDLTTRIAIAPVENHHQGGLVIYNDDDNYVRLTYAYIDGPRFEFAKETGGDFQPIQVPAPPDINDFHLRIGKLGTNYYGYYSQDGTNWTLIGMHQNVNISAIDIGLLAFNAMNVTTMEIPADFDYFRVTSSYSPDHDGDGIPDSIEINGYDYNGDGSIDLDLAALGAKWNHKDIFVQVDWLEKGGVFPHSHKPGNDSIDLVKQAFADAPVNNPDGSQGINLHVIFGNKIDETDQNKILGSVTSGCNYHWQPAFENIKNASLPLERRKIFHYVIFAHSLPNFSSPCKPGHPSGISHNSGDTDFQNGASDLIVALGGPWESMLNEGGVTYARAGTFMHELGHNLGLGHGGLILNSEGNVVAAEHTNNKPNHLSVMNYSFQTPGLRRRSGFLGLFTDGHFDYSRFGPDVLPNLDENHLSEPNGLGASDQVEDYGTRYYCEGSNEVKYIDGLLQAVDWNCNGSKTEPDVATSINNDARPDPPNTPPRTILSTVSEWQHLRFNGGEIGSFGVTVELPPTTSMAISPEITFEEDFQIIPPELKRKLIYIPLVSK